MAEQDMTGKVVVITGASSGFGKGAALRFARAKASLVLAARREGLLEDLARECESLGSPQALAVATDVGKQDQMERLADAATAQFEQLDVWVNNAGSGALGFFEEVPLEDHVRVIQTDLLGVLYGSYFALQQFKEQGRGILINMASVIGKVPAPYFASYAAAKHGVVGLSASIRQELEANNFKDIHVCTVMPTSFDTPFFEHAANYTGRESVPIPPVYDPEKVVDTIFQLASDPGGEVTVGAAGTFMTYLHQVAPGFAEAMMRNETHKAQMKKAEPAEETPGAVRQPTAKGTAVGGGWQKK